MGLNGAFLTGDLFNLFVFFEVLLAASYGLVLHGSGIARVRAGLHYVAINLLASLLFLIGVSLIYGVTGTLNMADLARDRRPCAVGIRARWRPPPRSWASPSWSRRECGRSTSGCPTTYAAATAPAAAMFSILSKVGIYAVLRLWLLMFGVRPARSPGSAAPGCSVGGLLTIAFGSVGVLASQNMARLAGCSVLVSSGTLLAAIGTGSGAVTGSALFYLASSVLGRSPPSSCSIELVDRLRGLGADVLAVTMEAFGEGDDEGLDETRIGIAIPAHGGPPRRAASSPAPCCWRGCRRCPASSPSSP